MKWLSFLSDHHFWGKGPHIKTMNPRQGDNLIELKNNDKEALFRCLKDHHQALRFKGTYKQFISFLEELKKNEDLQILRLRTTVSRKNQNQIFLHLKLKNNDELRRIITLE